MEHKNVVALRNKLTIMEKNHSNLTKLVVDINESVGRLKAENSAMKKVLSSIAPDSNIDELIRVAEEDPRISGMGQAQQMMQQQPQQQQQVDPMAQFQQLQQMMQQAKMAQQAQQVHQAQQQQFQQQLPQFPSSMPTAMPEPPQQFQQPPQQQVQQTQQGPHKANDILARLKNKSK